MIPELRQLAASTTMICHRNKCFNFERASTSIILAVALFFCHPAFGQTQNTGSQRSGTNDSYWTSFGDPTKTVADRANNRYSKAELKRRNSLVNLKCYHAQTGELIANVDGNKASVVPLRGSTIATVKVINAHGSETVLAQIVGATCVRMRQVSPE